MHGRSHVEELLRMLVNMEDTQNSFHIMHASVGIRPIIGVVPGPHSIFRRELLSPPRKTIDTLLPGVGAGLNDCGGKKPRWSWRAPGRWRVMMWKRTSDNQTLMGPGVLSQTRLPIRDGRGGGEGGGGGLTSSSQVSRE